MPETTNDSYLVDGRRLRAHPATNCFPLMRGTDFEALVADIWKNGCRVPVVIFDDFLLDGRNRALACERAGLTVPWETLPELCPRLDESAGKRRSTRIRHATPWLKTTLVQAAWAATLEERELSADAVSTAQGPARPEEGNRGGRRFHADRCLLHAPRRDGLPRPRRPVPGEPRQAPRYPAPPPPSARPWSGGRSEGRLSQWSP